MGLHLAYTVASEKSAWLYAAQESRADTLGRTSPAAASPVPPGILHWAEDWEQVLLQFPFRAQGSAGRTLGEEENSLTWTGTGEKLGEARNKRQKAGAGCWGGREQEPAGWTYPSSAHNTFISTFLCCQGWMGFKTGLMLPVIYNSTASYPASHWQHWRRSDKLGWYWCGPARWFFRQFWLF